MTEARISLHVYPSAPRNQVVGFSEGVLRVKIAAPPLKGQANRELVAFLSRLLGVSKGSLAILKGHTSRNKVIAVKDLSQEETIKRLWPG